jgi:hypothetical protein
MTLSISPSALSTVRLPPFHLALFGLTRDTEGGQPRVKVDVHGKETVFTPEEISAMVLGKVRFAKACFRE